MPIYEFRCPACGKRFEKLCALGDDTKSIHCPECGAAGPQRLLSTFAARGTDGGPAGGAGGGCSGCNSSSCAGCH
ncbi:MAG: zinc ribbon domain-containing protein [Thermoanaerobacterales bacterium]|nr:zinc ribbon domain-containing protein [Bacillota bacterium]MDI6906506.1 zinc ribbon domain-containing protein [Thermoanaerobacterales bacterium]